MKKIIIILAALLIVMPSAAKAKKEKEAPKDTLIFTTVLENPISSVKNQKSSGTCWCYSTNSFLESEIMKKHPERNDIDLCESFVVSHTYLDRADRAVRTHGDVSFSQGGSFYDVIYCMKKYGMIPEINLMPYPKTLYGDSLFNFNDFWPPFESYVNSIAKSTAKKINPAWKKNVTSMLENYFGEWPTEFEYKGVKYTPQSFVTDYLDLNPDDYVSLTSFTHEPFYEPFVVEVQDNWRWAQSYNLPLDEFMRVMDESVRNGWTFAWGADVSEDGFSRRTGTNKCVATVPVDGKKDNVGSDQSRWTGEKNSEVNTPDVLKEKTITQEMRQLAYDNWETTDDHGMQIYGIAKDQYGREFFMMKNSWGDYGPYKGLWYVSKAFVAYKTMNIVINKNAIPGDIRKKLGI